MKLKKLLTGLFFVGMVLSLSAREIDAMKLKSSMTLFDCVEENSIFDEVLKKYFNGQRDELTLEKLDKQKHMR